MKSKKYSFKRVPLKLKFLMVILPVLISTLVVSSYLSSLLYKKALIKTGMEFTGYKARQLITYSDLQWNFLLTNNLSGNEEYINTVKETIKIFAEQIITKKGEVILAVLPDGRIDIATKEISDSDDIKNELKLFMENSSRWIDLNLLGIRMTGFHFYYAPFNWHVFIIQDSDSFFNTVSAINRQQIIVIFISLLFSVILIVMFVRHMTDPLKKVAAEVTEFTGLESDTQQIEIVFPDEIGELAYEYNIMISRLKRSYYSLKAIAEQEAAARKQVLAREMETLKVLGTASDYRDPETGAHIERVGYYSKLLASCLGESTLKQDMILMASPLHDIGKLGIPDSLLLKPGRLTEDEFEIIKAHTKMGYDILKNTESWYLRAGGEIALTHHEKYDGTGYPAGLKGKNIPLFGRIVCIADVFDALTSKRPYKEPWPLQKAFDYIDSESGKSFDPEITAYFLENRNNVETIFYGRTDS